MSTTVLRNVYLLHLILENVSKIGDLVSVSYPFYLDGNRLHLHDGMTPLHAALCAIAANLRSLRNAASDDSLTPSIVARFHRPLPAGLEADGPFLRLAPSSEPRTPDIRVMLDLRNWRYAVDDGPPRSVTQLELLAASAEDRADDQFVETSAFHGANAFRKVWTVAGLGASVLLPCAVPAYFQAADLLARLIDPSLPWSPSPLSRSERLKASVRAGIIRSDPMGADGILDPGVNLAAWRARLGSCLRSSFWIDLVEPMRRLATLGVSEAEALRGYLGAEPNPGETLLSAHDRLEGSALAEELRSPAALVRDRLMPLVTGLPAPPPS